MRYIVAAAAALAVAACQSGQPGKPSAADEEVARLVAARQGPEVDRICFSNDINGWNSLGRDAVLVRKGVSRWYKLDLTGTCQPDWAFDTIAINSRPAGTSCVTRGDRVTTDDRTIRGVCFIAAIHEWNEDAPVGGSPSAAGQSGR